MKKKKVFVRALVTDNSICNSFYKILRVVSFKQDHIIDMGLSWCDIIRLNDISVLNGGKMNIIHLNGPTKAITKINMNLLAISIIIISFLGSHTFPSNEPAQSTVNILTNSIAASSRSWNKITQIFSVVFCLSLNF